jgi:hypothetical protein
MAVTPTTITTEGQIYLTGSPINLRLRNLNSDATISSVTCELYIWTGNLNAPPASANYTLVASKVSNEDDYINFQIAEIVRSHINGTKFSFVPGNESPNIAGEGVFFQLKHQVTNLNGLIEAPITSSSKFATLGYRYDFEQVGNIAGSTTGQPYLNLLPINYIRNYTNRIKYFKRSFNLTQPLSTCTSENIISSTANPVIVCQDQRGDKFAVAYINRLGLWDYFTTFGKGVKTVNVDSDINPRLYRNPNSINNSINHSKNRTINTSEQSFVINTGGLTEDMTDQVEEVIYSPLVYLLEFTGALFTTASAGTTVDSTTVTVDSTLFTVDGDAVTAQDIGFYSTYKQIPVTCSNSSFIKKTRLNDKGKINYDLQLDVTMSRINNLR